jgi:prepilin-type N-terminal cleavage/methylation domain-containing protein
MRASSLAPPTRLKSHTRLKKTNFETKKVKKKACTLIPRPQLIVAGNPARKMTRVFFALQHLSPDLRLIIKRLGESDMRNSRPVAGFTMLELLIAVTLMAILTSAVGYVFVTAKNLFVQADSTIQIYQNARNALDVMERELSVMEKTHDINFFIDSGVTANKHFDQGEQHWGLGNRLEPPDPSYAYAMTIYGNEYPDPGSAYRPHRADIIYFKSLTMVGGKERSALIIYRLDTADPTKPILKKYVLYKKIDPTTSSYTYIEEPPDGTGQDICLYVSDFEVKYYYDSPLDSLPPDFVSIPVNTKQVFCYIGIMRQGTIDASGAFSASGYTGTRHIDLFAQIGARDRVYLYDGQPKGENGWSSTNDSDYLIDTIDKNGKITFVTAEPPIPKNITGVNFRAAYLPGALKITLKVMDAKALQRRTITRIIKIKTR